MIGSVHDRLDAEWRVLGRRPVPVAWLDAGSGLREALEGQIVGPARRHPAGLVRLGAVVESCQDRADPASGNRVLGAVLGLAATGDELAARLALQALLPVVASTAAGMAGYVGRWGPWASWAELDGEAAATMAELVRSRLP